MDYAEQTRQRFLGEDIAVEFFKLIFFECHPLPFDWRERRRHMADFSKTLQLSTKQARRTNSTMGKRKKYVFLIFGVNCPFKQMLYTLSLDDTLLRECRRI